MKKREELFLVMEKREKLLEAAKDVNEMGIDPPIEIEIDKKTGVISSQLGNHQLESMIVEAAACIRPDEDEFEENTLKVWEELVEDMDEKVLRKKWNLEDEGDVYDETLKNLQAYGILQEEEEENSNHKKEQDKKPPKETDPRDLILNIQDAPKLKDLKDICKAEDEFKSIRSQLTKYKEVDDLRKEMLGILLKGEEPEEPEEVNPPKKEKTPEKPAKTSKKQDKSKKTEIKSTKVTKKSVIEQMIFSEKGATIESMAQEIVHQKIDEDYDKNLKIVKLWLRKMGFDVKRSSIEKNPNFKK